MRIIINGMICDKTYEEICRILGYNPSVHFIKVTSTGRVSFTIGRPNEIRDLFHSIQECGMEPSKNLVSRVRNM